jgi:hypothetical protein
MMTTQQATNEHDAVSTYERLAAKTHELLQRNKGRSADWLNSAIDTAATQLDHAGEYTKEETAKAKNFLKRDLEATKQDYDEASKYLKKALHPSRVGGGFVNLAAHLFDATGEAFRKWGEKSKQAVTYRTGETTSPGTLTCIACGQTLSAEKTTRIPPCPKCQETTFRKSY